MTSRTAQRSNSNPQPPTEPVMMNQQQKKYAIERVEQILDAKIKHLNKKCTIPGVSLSFLEKLEALKEGSFKIRSDCNGYHSWYQCIIFDDERVSGFKKEEFETEASKLKAKAESLKDEIMLGSGASAILSKIKEFDTQ